jgi:hypothetical protein
MRHPDGKRFAVVLILALLGIRCAGPRPLPALEKPTRVHVEEVGPLIVKVSDVAKHPLPVEELAAPTTAGFLWEYRITISNPTATAVSLDRLRLTVQNLWGKSWPADQPLNLTVPGGSEGQVVVRARLASSDPQDRHALSGVETVTFLGRRADGAPIAFTVRVPLD